MRAVPYLREAHRDELLYERRRQGTVDREMQGAFGHGVVAKPSGKLLKDRAAERQIAQVVIERGKPGDGVTVNAESGDPVGYHLLCVGDDLEDGASQRLKRAALWLLVAPRYSSTSWADSGAESRRLSPISVSAGASSCWLGDGYTRRICSMPIS